MSHTFEVCIDSVASAIAAENGGANRVELCDNLVEGGTTPSLGMVETVVNHCSLPVMVIIRPRGGDFLYSTHEFEGMKRNITWMKKAGAYGVVIGLLKSDGSIDLERTRELITIARPLTVTFHRAFDMCVDPFLALDQLIDLDIDHLLSSGQADSALNGAKLLKELQERANGRIDIMPGGGIDENNIEKLIRQTGVTAFHASGRHSIESHMHYRKKGVFMGRKDFPEFQQKVASEDRIKTMWERAQSAWQG